MSVKRFLPKPALAGLAVVVAGLVTAGVSGQAEARERWKMHSAFAEKLSVIGPPPVRLAEDLERMSDGEFQIRVFEPGALVPAIQYYDAVSEGSVDAAWGTAGFNANKNSAYNFFGAVPFGPGGGEYLAWMYHGGGLELATELYGKDNIKYLLCGIIPPETSGWFRNEITSLDQLKGLKMRFYGLGAKVMEKFGVSTQLLAAGDIYPALELGTIDATEFSLPSIDRDLGFYQIAKHNYFPGWHQQSTLNEILVNQDKWDALSDPHKAMLETACKANVARMFAEGEALQFKAMQENQEKGVQIHRWPDETLAKFEEAWKQVAQEEAAGNPDSAKIWESYSKFRDDYAIWRENGYLK